MISTVVQISRIRLLRRCRWQKVLENSLMRYDREIRTILYAWCFNKVTVFALSIHVDNLNYLHGFYLYISV